MAKHHRLHHIQDLTTQHDSLIERARRARRKGEHRKALVALREACLADESSAWLWTLYGSLLAECGRVSDACQALRHAIWLRRSAGDTKRVKSTERVLGRIAGAGAAA